MTHPALLLAGTRLPVGLGYSTVLPEMDFETFSEAGQVFDVVEQRWKQPAGASGTSKGISLVGAAVYATHPSTDVLCLSYNLKDGSGPKRWLPWMPSPADLLAHIQRGGLIEAWNVAFEWWIWNYVCVRRYGWPPLRLEQTRCAMGKSRASSWPGKLDKASEAMRLTTPKDEGGSVVMKKLSQPRNPTKGNPSLRHTPADAPADFARLYAYCDTDIMAEAEASSLSADQEGEELEFWLADQRICRRGVAVDVSGMQACVRIVELCLQRYDAELHQLTGGVVERGSQTARLAEWLRSHGVPVRYGKGAMDDEAVPEYLAWIDAQPNAASPYRAPCLIGPRRALEIRQLVGSASVKKVFAMRLQLSQWGRLHDLFNYWAAITGRPTGEGPQPTNMPKAGPKVWRCLCGRHTGMQRATCAWCGMLPPLTEEGKVKRAAWTPEAVEDVLYVLATGDLSLVENVYGDAMLCVSGCIRGLFVAADGHELICSDFSSIEGVVTACIAGENWRVDMFRTHSKAYELSVSKITGIPFAEIMATAGYDVSLSHWWLPENRKFKGPHHPMRQTIGKVAELASGFGGGIGAWKRFGADAFMSDDEIRKAIRAWREASPAIVHLWGGQERKVGYNLWVPERYGLEGMAINAIENPGQWFAVTRLDGTHSGVKFYCCPHDDALFCVLPSGRALTYRRPRLEANPKDFGGPLMITFERYNTNPQYGAVGWVRIDTYGGKLCENIVQATARDIQRYAIINLEKAGYPVVLHVYDEDVVEVPIGVGSIEQVEAIMGTMPPWAVYKGQPWPIKAAGGWRGRRYRKED